MTMPLHFGKQKNLLFREDFKSLFSLLFYHTMSRHVQCPCPEVELQNTPGGFRRYFIRRPVQVCKIFNSLEVSCILTCLSLAAPSLLYLPQTGENAAFMPLLLH